MKPKREIKRVAAEVRDLYTEWLAAYGSMSEADLDDWEANWRQVAAKLEAIEAAFADAEHKAYAGSA